MIAADYGGGNAINYTYDPAGNLLRREVTSTAAFASVSSASFAPGQALAAEVIAAGFGPGLASGVAVATETPLPTELLGTRVEVTDSQGVTRAAPLFFVSPGQINYLIPEGTALGSATVKVTSGAGGVIIGVLNIESVAPSLYAVMSRVPAWLRLCSCGWLQTVRGPRISSSMLTLCQEAGPRSRST